MNTVSRKMPAMIYAVCSGSKADLDGQSLDVRLVPPAVVKLQTGFCLCLCAIFF
jgi:hypothetical protein